MEETSQRQAEAGLSASKDFVWDHAAEGTPEEILRFAPVNALLVGETFGKRREVGVQ